MASSLEDFLEPWDRRAHEDIDRAIGLALRALTELEHAITITLHCALYGLDRRVIEIITAGIPARAAMERICSIAALPMLQVRDAELVADARVVRTRLEKILIERNKLAHHHLFPTDSDAEYFVRFTPSRRESGDVSVASLEELRRLARELKPEVWGIARRLLAAIADGGAPKESSVAHRRVYASEHDAATGLESMP